MTALQLAGVPLMERLRLYKFFKHMPIVSAKPKRILHAPPYEGLLADKSAAARASIYSALRVDWVKE